MPNQIINVLTPSPLTLLLLVLLALLSWIKPVRVAAKETYKVFVQIFKALSYTVPFVASYVLINFLGRGLEAVFLNPETQETLVQAGNTIEKVQAGLGATSRATQQGLSSINFGVITVIILGGALVYLLFKNQDTSTPTPAPLKTKKKKGK